MAHVRGPSPLTKGLRTRSTSSFGDVYSGDHRHHRTWNGHITGSSCVNRLHTNNQHKHGRTDGKVSCLRIEFCYPFSLAFFITGKTKLVCCLQDDKEVVGKYIKADNNSDGTVKKESFKHTTTQPQN